jgi:hypothetical protein
MKRIVQTLFLLAATMSLALVQSSAKDSPAAPSSDVQTITQMENDWATALIKADSAFVDRIEAPEYLFTGPDGAMSNRADGIAELKTGVYVCTSFKIDDLKVVVIDNTAIAYGLETEKSTYKKKDSSGQFRFTDVYVKRNGTWTAVATHVSKVEIN